MLPEDRYFRGDKGEAWQRYCGFTDISLHDFMQVQERLLMEQLELVAGSPLGQRLTKGLKPASVSEFRRTVPLTTYDEYAGHMDNGHASALVVDHAYWAHTSGRSGTIKWVPYTEGADEVFCRAILGAAILSLASQRGEVNLAPGVNVLTNLPERPYISGHLAFNIAKRFTWHNIPPLELAESMGFQERTEKGLKMALGRNVDLIISMSSVLIKLCDSYAGRTRSMKLSRSLLRPRTLLRLARAQLKSRREGRPVLPRDLWPVKAVLSWGSDLSVHKERIRECWGKEPLEFYAFVEAGFVAMQAWNRQGLTFLPHSVFLEFLPEEEWLKGREDPAYQPSTVLLDEVQPGERYELVISSFYGMPFMRYRVGDFLRIVADRDEETGISTPQMVFDARADEIIDIAGFTRLDEKTMLRAMTEVGVNAAEWTARKEYQGQQPILHVYLEPSDSMAADGIDSRLQDKLAGINEDYRNLDEMLGLRPLRVTYLPPGTFRRFSEAKRAAGARLAHQRPPRMNAPEEVMRDLLTAV